jgi:tetratricopeptide (TPR) repeat protein
MDSNHPAALRWRSLALAGLERHTEAMADIQRAISLEPLSSFAFAIRSDIWSALGNETEANADFARATELDPNLQDS